MDIDIDVPTNINPLELFDYCVKASMVKNDTLIEHPAGIYFQNIPIDKQTGLAAIPYKDAERLHYTKIDLLHLSLLDNLQTIFTNKQQIRVLINTDPDWSMLNDVDIVSQLIHINNHFDVVQQINPCNVQELADCLALIRPAKRFLLPYYNRTDDFRYKLYSPPDNNKYYFKKGHAISYALTIVLQMHLIKGHIL